jgi:hypothetical protein
MGIIKLRNRIQITGHYKLTFQNIHTGRIRISEYDNAITDVCLAMLAKRLGGAGNDCNITYIAVGTGAYPATPKTSTTLTTELARKTVTAASYSGAQTLITGFFGASEGNGTLTEIGLFGEDASASADSGTMINHASITETKSSSETLTAEITISFS